LLNHEEEPMLVEEAQLLLADRGYTEWEVVDEATLICPHGHAIEWDGECPEGCVSPLDELGVI
jgi:hypothetical protein